MSTDHAAMRRSIAAAAARYPHCRVANCDCKSRDEDEWKRDCWCLCHFQYMNTKYGRDMWRLTDFERECRAPERT